jgi:hypothetical protein
MLIDEKIDGNFCLKNAATGGTFLNNIHQIRKVK